jgi:hypothetical protein
MMRALLALIALVALCACGTGVPHLTGRAIPAVPAQDTSAAPKTAAEATGWLADTGHVKGRAPKTGYDRAQFGKPWVDVDRNGCDTRDDILARDLRDVVRDGCTVKTGTLVDPYSGRIVQFVRGVGTSSQVQIDHVVALSNAWQTGAQGISAGARVRLANDPRNLLAVYGPENEQKSDGDAATWLPPLRSEWCTYGLTQVQVKAAYSLWVTPAEADALRRLLATCT